MVEVGDEGPGIAADERDHVFERFTRGERATGGGTGLGLAIARWVVDLHGGTIAVVDPAEIHSGNDADPSTAAVATRGSTKRGCLIRVALPGQ